MSETLSSPEYSVPRARVDALGAAALRLVVPPIDTESAQGPSK